MKQVFAQGEIIVRRDLHMMTVFRGGGRMQQRMQRRVGEIKLYKTYRLQQGINLQSTSQQAVPAYQWWTGWCERWWFNSQMECAPISFSFCRPIMSFCVFLSQSKEASLDCCDCFPFSHIVRWRGNLIGRRHSICGYVLGEYYNTIMVMYKRRLCISLIMSQN